MDAEKLMKDYKHKFSKLSEPGQRYIVAKQQALIYLQTKKGQFKKTSTKKLIG